jgi:hypothetical protein
LPPEDALLHVPGRMVRVVVESHFAPGDHARVVSQPINLLEVRLCGQLCFLRMDPDRGVNPIVLFGKGQRRIELLWPRAAADGQYRLDASLPRALEHCDAVSIELREIEVRVRINQFHGEP